jgi:hypothetical protein
MLHILLCTAFCLVLLFSGCEKKSTLSAPQVSISQGEYVNMIRVWWDAVPNADHYLILPNEYNKEWNINYISDTEFLAIGSVNQEDTSNFLSISFTILASQYEYQSEATLAEGFSAKLIKPVITSVTRSVDLKNIVITWESDNPVCSNEINRNYMISIYPGSDGIPTTYTVYDSNDMMYEIRNVDTTIKYRVVLTEVIEYYTSNPSGFYDKLYLSSTYNEEI